MQNGSQFTTTHHSAHQFKSIRVLHNLDNEVVDLRPLPSPVSPFNFVSQIDGTIYFLNSRKHLYGVAISFT